MSRDLEAGFQNFFASYAKGQKKHGETAITISPCYFSSGWNFTMSSSSQLKNLQSVSRVLVETDSFACIRRMVELLIPALACKVYVVAACRFMVCHKGSYEIIPGRFLHFLLYISLLLPIMEE